MLEIIIKLQQTAEGQIKANQRCKFEKHKENELLNNRYPDSNENFYFIAGHTSGGMPYIITWGEAENEVFFATPGLLWVIVLQIDLSFSFI